MFKAIKRVKKMGIIAFLMIIQLSVGLTMINSSGKLFSDSQNRKKGIESLFDLDNTTYVKIFPKGGYEARGEDFWSAALRAKEQVGDIYDKLIKENLINNYYIYESGPNVFEEFRENIPEKYNKMGDVGQNYIGEVIINKNFFNHYNLKISSGRNFVEEDFKKDYKKENIPIVIGKDFEGVYELGKTFKVKYISEAKRRTELEVDLTEDFITFEIIGFLESNAIPFQFGPAELFASSLYYSDGIKIIPVIENFIGYDFYTSTIGRGIFLERKENITEEELMKRLNKELNENELQANLYSLSNTTTLIESYERDVKSSLVLGALLLILSMAGTSCIILGQLKKRTKEFGIKLAMGATLENIAKEIILDILTITVAAVIIAIITNLNLGINSYI
ncbi:MAG: FtsX-like permease family protein, partial [Clostridium sp.]|uniref:FtsX-like permease family protein n=1 Tax=Clostridium sp. TaxID=1506 RepID=UPI003EE68A5F